jgi:hypothetical protein
VEGSRLEVALCAQNMSRSIGTETSDMLLIITGYVASVALGVCMSGVCVRGVDVNERFPDALRLDSVRMHCPTSCTSTITKRYSILPGHLSTST